MTTEPTVEIPLTEEQQALIHHRTGEHATVLELTPEPGETKSGTGAGLRFKWRLSVASGIPRLAWRTATAEAAAPDRGPCS